MFGGITLSDCASIATVGTGLAAVAALILAGWQTRQFRAHQLETTAREQYQGFLALCVQYPQYAPPDPQKLKIAELTFDGSAEKFAQYEWFFTAGSNSLEAIYGVIKGNTSWDETIISVMQEHADYISSKSYSEVIRPTVDPDFQSFIDERIIRRKPCLTLHHSETPATI